MNTPIVPLHSWQKGEGSAIVLLHGFCEDGLMWQHFADLLCPHHRVVVIDLPGFGSSPPLPDEANIPYMAEAVQATLQHLKVEKYVVVGHSMGGYVALQMAAQKPDVMRGLMLFHSTAFADDEAKRASRKAAIASIQEYGTRPFLTNFFTALFTPAYAQQQPEVVQAMKHRAQQLPAHSLTAALQAMKTRPDFTHLLPQLPFPVGFIAGETDTFVPLAKTLMECYLPQVSAIHILPDVGHAGMLEQPQQTATWVRRFVEELCGV